jgi:hypothetical protein
MTGGAIGMFIFGATLLWGGLAVTITIAIRKNKTKA